MKRLPKSNQEQLLLSSSHNPTPNPRYKRRSIAIPSLRPILVETIYLLRASDRSRASGCLLEEMVAGGPGLECWFQKLVVGDGESKMAETGGWKDLPMELLLRILAGLDDQTIIVAAGVCTGWRDAISLGLTRLSLTWCKNRMDNLLSSLAPKFTKLQVLCLRQSKPQLRDNAISVVSSYCHDLRDIDLSKSLKLTDQSLHSLAHGCPRLTKLNISGCVSFSDSALSYLTAQCRGLKKLNLCGCVNAATDRALQAVSLNCPQLQSLNLGWCDKVSDRGVTSLAVGCPDLRALDLCGCILITDESVVAVASRCTRLKSLGLYYCQCITDRAMYSLAKSRRNMVSSARSSIDEGLTSLNISQCTALTAAAVQSVCNSFPSLHTCPVKHSLIISGCLGLTSVRCACSVQAGRDAASPVSHHAY